MASGWYYSVMNDARRVERGAEIAFLASPFDAPRHWDAMEGPFAHEATLMAEIRLRGLAWRRLVPGTFVTRREVEERRRAVEIEHGITDREAYEAQRAEEAERERRRIVGRRNSALVRRGLPLPKKSTTGFLIARICAVCNEEYIREGDAIYCSRRCNKAAERARKRAAKGNVEGLGAWKPHVIRGGGTAANLRIPNSFEELAAFEAGFEMALRGAVKRWEGTPPRGVIDLTYMRRAWKNGYALGRRLREERNTKGIALTRAAFEVLHPKRKT